MRKSMLRGALSLKFVLILSFIILMAISGVLGFILTYIQSKKSLNDVAEISMDEAIYTVVQSVMAKLAIGHQMNRLEQMFFLGHNLTMTNFVNAHYIWRYLTVQNIMTEINYYVTKKSVCEAIRGCDLTVSECEQDLGGGSAEMLSSSVQAPVILGESTPTSNQTPRSHHSGDNACTAHYLKVDKNSRKKSTNTVRSRSRVSSDRHSGVRRKSTYGGGGIQAAMQVGGLSQRFLSCLQVDMKGIHKMLQLDSTVTVIHSEVMESVTQAVQQHFGMCNPLLGDKIIAFWNVKSPKADHALHCASAALQIATRISKLQGAQEELQGARISCTASLGQFGSMGTKTSRSFTILSSCIPRGFFLQKLSKLIPFAVVCDSVIQERITYRFNTRLVCVLPKPEITFSSEKSSAVAAEKVYEVSVSDSNLDEWMYELQQKEIQQRKNIDFELGVRALYSGNESTAIEHFKSFNSMHPTDLLAGWYLSHSSDVSSKMVDPQYGIMVPVSIFL